MKSRSGKEVIAPSAMPEIKTLEALDPAREPRIEGYYNVAGKLKLQSMEKENIFFSDWVKASVFYEGFKQPKAFEIHSGLKDIRGKTTSKKVDVPVESTIINAIYLITLGSFTSKTFFIHLKYLCGLKQVRIKME
ncbi:MAG: hypothetical protein IPJ32_00085 [Sphingobacteriaceae bacterium]|nr:hypothetical protein [Sphingobacteriaceae bacterium]